MPLLRCPTMTRIDERIVAPSGRGRWRGVPPSLVAYAAVGMLLFVAPTGVTWTTADLLRALVQAAVATAVLIPIVVLGRRTALILSIPTGAPSRRQLAISVVVAVIAAFALLAIDLALTLVAFGDLGGRGVFGVALWLGLDPRYTTGYLVASVGGGIVEELFFRLGLMTFIAWTLFRLGQGRGTSVARGLVIATVLFALAHGVTIAALALHLPAGATFGLLYRRRSIESAILAHVAVNVGGFLMATAVAPLFV